MAEQWQIRRGTTGENNNFTGAVGELTMDTSKKGLRIHDGVTQGGIEVPTAGTTDYVVEWQEPTADNSYTWYRKYKSGWVEQGGINTSTTAALRVVTLAVPLATSPRYPTIHVSALTDATESGTISAQWGVFTGTTFSAGIRWGSVWASAWFSWTAFGMIAEGE